jgi:hypothetical protein
LRSSSKLKRGVIEGTGGLFLVFRDREFFFPNIFCWFLCAVNRDEDIVRESFSVKFILHSSDIRLSSTFYEPFFHVVFCVCSFGFFSSQPDVVNITWITGRIHRSIVDKIDPTLWGCRKGKKIPYQLHSVTYFCEIWSDEFIYRAFNWSVKNTFDEPWRGPPFFFSSKVEEWLMMAIVIEICSLNLFVVLNLDLEPIWIENSFFFVSQNLESNIIYFICFEYEKGYAVYVCRFLWKYPIPRHVR